MRFVVAVEIEGLCLHDADLRAAIVECLTARLNTTRVAVSDAQRIAGTPT